MREASTKKLRETGAGVRPSGSRIPLREDLSPPAIEPGLEPSSPAYGTVEPWSGALRPSRTRERALVGALVVCAIAAPLVASGLVLGRLYLGWGSEAPSPDEAVALWRVGMAIASVVSLGAVIGLAAVKRPALPAAPRLRALEPRLRLAAACAGEAQAAGRSEALPLVDTTDRAETLPSQWSGAANAHGSRLTRHVVPDVQPRELVARLAEAGLSGPALEHAAEFSGMADIWERCQSVAVLLASVQATLPPEAAERVFLAVLRSCAERALEHYGQRGEDTGTLQLAIALGLDPRASRETQGEAEGLLDWVYDSVAASRRMSWLEWKSAHVVQLALMCERPMRRALTVTRALAALEGYVADPTDDGRRTYADALCMAEHADAGVAGRYSPVRVHPLVWRAFEAERARQLLLVASLAERELRDRLP